MACADPTVRSRHQETPLNRVLSKDAELNTQGGAKVGLIMTSSVTEVLETRVNRGQR